ncbi:peptidylprolyl isomerase [Gimesia aquarii]|uniref:Peptidyl-prolyl cis-trans isomerase n=1 Tax=Gimesia aquarii TaxID=2527964 RepID=A0A517WTT3_9PLAN|nr:peptidylprolyl isomerase [Gimesia aquarii]QDU08628.1 Peptidyl-prolyl cis-trans isomerase B [Gimesia aquarii]
MMSRFTPWILCLAVSCLAGCPGETPTASDPEVPQATSQKQLETLPAGGDFQVLLETTKGNIVLDVHPEWSPKGAARFKELVEEGFYNDTAFFRVIDGFMAQIGINGDPAVHAKWKDNNIMDEPVVESNKRGYVSFAKSGLPNSRSTQFFINFGDNSNLDGMGFSPFAQVIEGMDVVDDLYDGYGEGAPNGRGPHQGKLVEGGNAYLKKEFPMLDYIKKATIVDGSAKEGAKPEAAAPDAKADKKPAEPEKKEEAKPEKAAPEKTPAKKDE